MPTAEALAALPTELLSDLQRATARADLHLILRLASHVHEHDAAPADGLAYLARTYEYKKMLSLIEQVGG